MNTIIPDSITPNVGWKGWKLQEGFLSSPSYEHIWKPLEKVEAQCKTNISVPYYGQAWFWAAYNTYTEEIVYHTHARMITHGAHNKMPHWEIDESSKPDIILPPGWKWEPRWYDPTPKVNEKEPSPHKNCSCGIYAATDVLEGHRYTDRDDTSIVGQIYGWGKVVVGETGFRAQYAYPKVIFFKDSKLRRRKKKEIERQLALYEVPVHAVSSMAVAYTIAQQDNR